MRFCFWGKAGSGAVFGARFGIIGLAALYRLAFRHARARRARGLSATRGACLPACGRRGIQVASEGMGGVGVLGGGYVRGQ